MPLTNVSPSVVMNQYHYQIGIQSRGKPQALANRNVPSGTPGVKLSRDAKDVKRVSIIVLLRTSVPLPDSQLSRSSHHVLQF